MESEFEKKLSQQSLRELPPEWRRDVLAAARAEIAEEDGSWMTILQSLIWPNQKAWAALAAIWIALLVLQFGTGAEGGPAPMAKSSSSPTWIAVLQEQQRLLRQLAYENSTIFNSRPAAVPAPQSRSRKEQNSQLV